MILTSREYYLVSKVVAVFVLCGVVETADPLAAKPAATTLDCSFRTAKRQLSQPPDDHAFLPLRCHADAMNSSRPFTRTADKLFRPALSYLNNVARDLPNNTGSYAARRKNSASSLDDTDHSDIEQYAQMDGSRLSHSSKNSLSELQPTVPLIDIGSRSNSPYPRSRSAVQSEDEDDDFEPADSIRPLVNPNVGRGSRKRGVWSEGGLGGFFYGTWMGWQVYVALLVFK
jgi:hypothetical protein